MTPRYTPNLTLPNIHPQSVAVAFDAPPIVTDVGLLGLRDLDVKLGYLADLVVPPPLPALPGLYHP